MIESRDGGTRKRRAGSEDVEIGRKIRALRLQRGLSQTSLADGIGLTFAQEHLQNRRNCAKVVLLSFR